MALIFSKRVPFAASFDDEAGGLNFDYKYSHIKLFWHKNSGNISNLLKIKNLVFRFYDKLFQKGSLRSFFCNLFSKVFKNLTHCLNTLLIFLKIAHSVSQQRVVHAVRVCARKIFAPSSRILLGISGELHHLNCWEKPKK